MMGGMLLLLSTLALAVPQTTLSVGGIGGVDLYQRGDLRAFHGSAYRIQRPSPHIAISFSSAKHPGLWWGLHSAPFYAQLRSVSIDHDMVGVRTSSPGLGADIGFSRLVGEVNIGPYVSAGWSAAELGLDARWLRERVGVEWRAAWFAPHAVGTSVSLCVRLGQEPPEGEAERGRRNRAGRSN